MGFEEFLPTPICFVSELSLIKQMGFEEFLPKIEEGEPEHIKQPVEKITQSHVYDVITSRKPDWQTIIYELINS